MENVVYFPFSGQRQPYREGGDASLNLEGTMILVIHFPRGVACFDISSIKHYEVPYLVCRRRLSVWVLISSHSFLRCFQAPSGFVLHRFHPVGIDGTGGINRFLIRVWRIYRSSVEAVIGVKGRDSVSRCDRIIVSELGHREQPCPIILLVSHKCSEVGLDCLVEPFRLSVRLWVECRRHPGSDP